MVSPDPIAAHAPDHTVAVPQLAVISAEDIASILTKHRESLRVELRYSPPVGNNMSPTLLELRAEGDAVVIRQQTGPSRVRESSTGPELFSWSVQTLRGVRQHLDSLRLLVDSPSLKMTEIPRDGERDAVVGVDISIPTASWNLAEIARFQSAVTLRDDLRAVLCGVDPELEFNLSPDAKNLAIRLSPHRDTSDEDVAYEATDYSLAWERWSRVTQNLACVGITITGPDPELRPIATYGYGSSHKDLVLTLPVDALDGSGKLRAYVEDSAKRASERYRYDLLVKREPLLQAVCAAQLNIEAASMLPFKVYTPQPYPSQPLSCACVEFSSPESQAAADLLADLQRMCIEVHLQPPDPLRGNKGPTIVIEDPLNWRISRLIRQHFSLD